MALAEEKPQPVDASADLAKQSHNPFVTIVSLPVAHKLAAHGNANVPDWQLQFTVKFLLPKWRITQVPISLA